MAWDSANAIQPVWQDGRLPVLWERLRKAGVPPPAICRVMRHSSWETTRKHCAPGDVQRDAEGLRDALGLTGPDPNAENTEWLAAR